jgi:minor extracellular serine protease Vpr
LWLLRRLTVLVVCVAALLSAIPAAAELRPIRRAQGEVEQAVVRAGTPYIPARHRQARVIVGLAQPPLAAWNGRALHGRKRAKLNVAARSSQRYVKELAALQLRAEARLERAVPSAIVRDRYRVLLNGFAVELPLRELPQLLRLGFARVYPDLRYTLATNRSPDVIRAAAFSGLRGLRGDGIKIGVVDDGIDPRNPFFAPEGYDYPAGFPKGGLRWTTTKIIVARTFPGPNSGRQGRLAFVPNISFHGSHVAGIAAGNAQTSAPAGPDHPPTPGLSGVAPRAWLGNYRVFNEPTPIGHVANTTQIVAAFEAAVQDGMDVVNFSGGGAMGDPVNDPLLEAVANLARAGVVPVISAGNDRDDFGFGTVGSPGVAEEAISVAATSNEHVFAPPLSVTAPGAPASLQRVPFASAFPVPPAWAGRDQTLVDVGAIIGRSGEPVERKLCGNGGDVNDPASNPLPAASLSGVIALVSRGVCTFASKAQRAQAAGAAGVVVVDNRFGEANVIPVELALPAGMISDLDGAVLRSFMAQSSGRTTIRVATDPAEISTGRSGVITSFSSAAPTNFGHSLKPDVAAPGGHILSSTSPESAGNGTPFAVFDGTSMSAPHVTGAVALLRQAHPTWNPRQFRSALVTTAGPAWGNTARTQEAPVVLQGGGMIDVVRADEPQLFTRPVSLSFGDLNVNRGARSVSLVVTLEDAGGGAGEWGVEVRAQSASAGASIVPEPVASLAPAGEDQLLVVARAAARAPAGDNYGLIVLRRGDVTRRIPYYFAVTRPGLESKPAQPLAPFQEGDTATGISHASQYRFPTWPFGPPPDYVGGPPMDQDGAEDLYTILFDEPVVNFGAAVWSNSSGAFNDPWILGSPDENDVQGQGATPINVNNFTFGYQTDVGAAGIVFPRPKKYWISVDAGRDIFTNRRLAGRYRLHSWVNDVEPPVVRLLSTRVSAGRPIVLARVVDFPARGADSGIDPSSLVLGYRQALVAATEYDSSTGLVVFRLPAAAPTIRAGRLHATIIAADFQEAKNITAPGGAILPNTTFARVRLRGVAGPTVTWISPNANACVDKRRERLLVLAGSTVRVRSVTFFADGEQIIRREGNSAELYSAAWQTARASAGAHRLTAVVRDARGREARATRTVRVCK